MIDKLFWKNKSVFITGHTGFKGSWLCLWLHKLEANVTGYSLEAPTNPSLFELAKVGERVSTVIADIRDDSRLKRALRDARPEIVFHLAAQPLVRDSYASPVETYTTNVIGTVNLLEAVRQFSGVRSVVNVTSDKCYENREWVWGYRENESLGGFDPYSSSKACSELITAAYRNSYFHPKDYEKHGVGVASARAGNVFGGGDWAQDRLIPDCFRALMANLPVMIRNPDAIRPWQHVIEPLYGYLLLAQKLYEDGAHYSEAWNFGPSEQDAKSVRWLVTRLLEKWKGESSMVIDQFGHPHEAGYLKLDCSKAMTRLGWHPVWDIDQGIDAVIEWMEEFVNKGDLEKVCFKQIDEFSQYLSGV